MKNGSNHNGRKQTPSFSLAEHLKNTPIPSSPQQDMNSCDESTSRDVLFGVKSCVSVDDSLSLDFEIPIESPASHHMREKENKRKTQQPRIPSREITRADLFARDYDNAMKKIHHPLLLAIIDAMAFAGLLLKLVWPAVYPFIAGPNRAGVSKVAQYLPYLALVSICFVSFLFWPLSYIGGLRRYSGMAPSFVFHIGYTVANIILLVVHDHNFWWLLLMDLPLFAHSLIIFSWQNYQMHIEGSEHRRLVMNAYFTRPVQHLQAFLFITLEYVDTYQGYYSYWAHKNAVGPIRSSYIAFAAINSFLIPVVFIISSSIGSTTPKDWFLKNACCGCIYDMRRNFALNLIDFFTDVPFIIIKSIDFKTSIVSGGWFKITLYVFNILMCLKSLIMGVFGLFLVFVLGCDNDCYDCTRVCNRFPVGDYRLEDIKRVFRETPWRFFIICPLLPCFAYRDSFCGCLPDWIGKQRRAEQEISIQEVELDCSQTSSIQ